MQSLFAGMVPKPHSEYLDTPEQFVPWSGVDEPSAAEQAAGAPPARARGVPAPCCAIAAMSRSSARRRCPSTACVVDGDAAVVGMLRPTPERCLLALIQFADRPAHVAVRLAAPDDVPPSTATLAGHPEIRAWRVQEIQRSMVNDEVHAPGDTLPGARAGS